jgi:hypothetical protein
VPVYACSTAAANDLNGCLLSEYEQLRVNAAASQMPSNKQRFEAICINNAGHQFAGRRSDLSHQTRRTYSRMAIYRVDATPADITLFDLLATRQGKTAQGGGAAQLTCMHYHSCRQTA